MKGAKPMPYQTEADIKRVVEGFESCTTDKAAFKHQDHLTVAVCYLQDSTVEEATVRLRIALLRFLDHHKVDRQKYNETITFFWLELVAAELHKLSQRSLAEQCNAVIEILSDAGLMLQYYSSDLLFSQQARASFVEPDLKSWRS
jgi:hypothetical protein